MTTPTPPIELTGSGQRLAGDVAPLPPSLLDRLSAICETITDITPVAEASRDWWPLALHWSLAGMVPCLAAAVVRPTTTSRGGGDPRRLQRGADPGHRGRWSKRRVRGVGADPRRCRARHHRARRHRRDRRRVGCRRGGRRNVRARPGVRAAGRARAHRRPLPAELRSGDGGWLGGLPRRRSVLHALRQDRGHGRRPRGRARRRDRDPNRAAVPPAPSDPISTSSSPDRRARSASSPGCGCAPIPCPVAERRAAYSVADVRGRRRGVPIDAPPRCDTGRAPAVRRRRRRRAGAVATARTASCSCSTRAIRPSSTPRCRWSPSRARRSEPPRPTRRSSPTGSNTATTRRPCRS